MLKRDDRIAPEQLQAVLLHLHDLGFLASQPIVDDLVHRLSRTPGTSGLDLRSLLLALIEQLKPNKAFDIIAPEWRHYIILNDRYVLQRPLWEIQHKLALGERQMRREHQRALAALSMLVQAHLRKTKQMNVESDPVPLAEAVQRLTPAPSFFPLLDLAEDIALILTHTHAARHNTPSVRFDVHVDPPALKIFTDRGIMHQLLLKLAQLCVQPGSESATPAMYAMRENMQVRIRFESSCEMQSKANQEQPQLCHMLAKALGADLDWQPYSVSFILPAGPHTRTVLIVDDEPSALELFRSYLSGLNYEVITESKAENVLPSITATRPDLVMLDIMMPAMDGWEVLQRLRHMPSMRDVPIVACSVLNDAELAYALGAARFLRKPVLRHHLIHAVNELLTTA
ncbi:MAG: response regulator [Chloroflexi bacterium]|nr:response regulator [Chloroflexota bacterium]